MVVNKVVSIIPRSKDDKFVEGGNNVHMPKHEFMQLLCYNGFQCCHICGRKGYLVVDHGHKSGLIRGLLCAECNNTVGIVEKYLRNPPCKQLGIIRPYIPYYPEQIESQEQAAS